MSSEVETLRGEKESLYQQLHSLKLEAQSAETHHKALEYEVSSLRKKMKSAEEQILTIRNTALAEAEGKMQLSTSKERRGWAEEKEGLLKTAATTAERVKKEIKALEESLALSKKETVDARLERDEVEARLQGELAALMETGPLNTSREEVSSLGERLRAMGKEKEVLERNIRGLKVELTREREEGGGAKKEVKGLLEALAAAKDERAALKAALESAREKTLGAEARASDVQALLSTTKARLEAAEAREQSVKAELLGEQAELRGVQAELLGVQGELAACRAESALALETSLNASTLAVSEVEGKAMEALASSRASAEAKVGELERLGVERERQGRGALMAWGVGSLLVGLAVGGGVGYGLAAHLAATAKAAKKL